ncbi:hypothetical protein [Paenibacillus sp. LjRoot153]|uniref:hypothetical protein n=1 Tax=Paenibacillus sp. LjRoot153 TaxID=3342270 RepID=UPI003F4FA150
MAPPNSLGAHFGGEEAAEVLQPGINNALRMTPTAAFRKRKIKRRLLDFFLVLELKLAHNFRREKRIVYWNSKTIPLI